MVLKLDIEREWERGRRRGFDDERHVLKVRSIDKSVIKTEEAIGRNRGDVGLDSSRQVCVLFIG